MQGEENFICPHRSSFSQIIFARINLREQSITNHNNKGLRVYGKERVQMTAFTILHKLDTSFFVAFKIAPALRTLFFLS